jgi:hypothetical protein
VGPYLVGELRRRLQGSSSEIKDEGARQNRHFHHPQVSIAADQLRDREAQNLVDACLPQTFVNLHFALKRFRIAVNFNRRLAGFEVVCRLFWAGDLNVLPAS